jgi:hypothetical protein
MFQRLDKITTHAGCFGRAEQPVDVPIRLQIDERDHVARLGCGDQDQSAVTGALVLVLGIRTARVRL